VRASRQPVLGNFTEMAEDCLAGLLHLWKAQPRLVLGAAQGGLMHAIADALEVGEVMRLVLEDADVGEGLAAQHCEYQSTTASTTGALLVAGMLRRYLRVW
jgi:hypothetical protein